jgi:hypothetical protein
MHHFVDGFVHHFGADEDEVGVGAQTMEHDFGDFVFGGGEGRLQGVGLRFGDLSRLLGDE